MAAMAEAARPQFDVRHNEGAKRFEIELAGPDGKPQLAIAEYRMHMGVGAAAGGAVTRMMASARARARADTMSCTHPCLVR